MRSVMRSLGVLRHVAVKELLVLWTSAVPWVVGALLHVVLGILVVNQLELRRLALTQPMVPIAGFLLVITVPLLCMRAVAEESRSGTLDLLQAAGVSTVGFVVGKWVACWVTALAILAPVGVHIGLLAWWGDPDAGPALTGVVGLALLAAVLVAIGVLASTLAPSQPVAAMVATAVGLVLWFSHVGSETLSAGSVLAHLSLSEHLRALAGGVVDTADLAVFALLTAAALVVAVTAVDARRLR